MAPLAGEEYATAQQAQPLADHGTNQHSGAEGGGRVADSHSKPARQMSSDSQERILRRLARDAPAATAQPKQHLIIASQQH